MDKIALEFDEAFWDKDDAWINYISNTPGDWALIFNLYPYLNKPWLVLFNVANNAKKFAEMTDAEVLESAMAAIRIMYPNAPDYVSYKRTNWSKDQYAK